MDCFAWSLFSEVSTMLLKKTDRYSLNRFVSRLCQRFWNHHTTWIQKSPDRQNFLYLTFSQLRHFIIKTKRVTKWRDNDKVMRWWDTMTDNCERGYRHPVYSKSSLLGTRIDLLFIFITRRKHVWNLVIYRKRLQSKIFVKRRR